MIRGRFQSIPPKEVAAFRKDQINEEMKRRPNYGLGLHVPGNKHPGKYCGGHHYKHAPKKQDE